MSEKKRHVRGEKPRAGENPILHFSLEGLLPKGEVLAVNAGNRNAEEGIGHIVANLPIPMLITRTTPEGQGGQEPVLAYHWHIQDKEGDGVTFAYGLEQALTHLMHQQRPS